MNHADLFTARSTRTGAILVGIGTAATGLIYGFAHAACFLAGGFLAAFNMAMLKKSINSALSRSENPKFRTVWAYLLRLLLIPLCLYVIMRLFFYGVIAAIAGFAVFGCGIFLEGVLEVFKSGSR